LFANVTQFHAGLISINAFSKVSKLTAFMVAVSLQFWQNSLQPNAGKLDAALLGMPSPFQSVDAVLQTVDHVKTLFNSGQQVNVLYTHLCFGRRVRAVTKPYSYNLRALLYIENMLPDC
jgi:hypothetical protein